MPLPGEGEVIQRPRRKTPDKLARAPVTEAITIESANGQRVRYYPEEFPSEPLFQPGAIFYAPAGQSAEPVAWEYLGRTADTPPQAVFARFDRGKDGQLIAVEVITRHHRTLSSFRSKHIPIEIEIEEV